MCSQGGSDSVEMGPLEVLTWHKEPLAFCAKLRAPQDGAKDYLVGKYLKKRTKLTTMVS
jgi:hypothetical protein